MSTNEDVQSHDGLCGSIREALTIADRLGNTLVAALLDQALDAAHCTGGVAYGPPD